MVRLFATTALVGTLALAAVPARAEMEVTIGGYVGFQAAMFDTDTANSTKHEFQSESEVHVKADAKTDQGLAYGAYLELMTSTSDSTNADEANIYISGSFGKVELGDQDGAASVLTVYAPYVGIGQAMGSFADFVPSADRAFTPSEGPGDPNFKAIDTADATKVTYYTPRFSGFQLGVSYAPERDSQADGEQVQFSDATGNHDNAFEFGLNYDNKFGDVGVKAGAGYVMADAKTGATVEDIRSFSLGAQVSYAGFAFGGGYTNNGDSGLTLGTANDDVSYWDVGLTYTSGAWGVGASIVQADFDTNGTPFGVAGISGAGGDFTAAGFGGTYKIAPGLTAGADLMFYERNRTGNDKNGYVAITEVRAAF